MAWIGKEKQGSGGYRGEEGEKRKRKKIRRTRIERRTKMRSKRRSKCCHDEHREMCQAHRYG
jgi:hypothetical protein